MGAGEQINTPANHPHSVPSHSELKHELTECDWEPRLCMPLPAQDEDSCRARGVPAGLLVRLEVASITPRAARASRYAFIFFTFNGPWGKRVRINHRRYAGVKASGRGDGICNYGSKNEIDTAGVEHFVSASSSMLQPYGAPASHTNP